jgi:hypothetical protein
MSVKMADYMDSMNYWKEKAEVRQNSNSDAIGKTKVNNDEKYEKLKRCNANLEANLLENDKIVSSLKIKYKKYHTDLQNVTNKVIEIKSFFNDNLQFINSLVREVSADKRYSHISRKLIDFQKKFDKLSISFNSFSSTKAISSQNEFVSNEKPSRMTSSSRYLKQSVEKPKQKLSRNNSIVSINSKRSNQNNRSRASLNLSNLSHSKKSLKNSSRPGTPQRVVTDDEIQENIETLQNDLEKLKIKYKKLLFQSKNEIETDPLIREKLNFFAQEIQLKTKKLLSIRKKQRVLFSEDL